jgi:hypothetical protein
MSKLTREEILNMPNDKYIKLISTEEGRLEVEKVWNEKPESVGGVLPSEMSAEDRAAIATGEVAVAEAPTAEEIAAEQAKAAEIERVAAEAKKADEEAKAAEEVKRKAAEESNRKKRFVVEYQATDADGKPIGRPTHLESETQEGLIEKMKTAHINAVRAYERLKQQKVTRRAEEPVRQGLSDEDLKTAVDDSHSKDPAVAAAAIRKIVGADEIQQERERNAIEREENRQRAVSLEFLKRHRNDFNNCDANVKELGDYITENQLEWTLDNLEVALANIESKLAPVNVPERINAPVPANPEPTVAPVATVPVPVETPAAPVPAAAPVTPAANATPVAPHKVPNGGLKPGQTAGRPSNQQAAPVGLTKQDIVKMSTEELKRRMRDPKLRAEIERVANS